MVQKTIGHEPQWQRWWAFKSCCEIKAVETSKQRATTEEIECENFSKSTFQHLRDGRCSVWFPFKQFPKMLDDSFFSMGRKLNRRCIIRELYIEENNSLNHMEKMQFKKSLLGCHFFLPHHCVHKNDSSTKKLCVRRKGVYACAGLTIVLSSITYSSHNFNTFVANRISKIQC